MTHNVARVLFLRAISTLYVKEIFEFFAEKAFNLAAVTTDGHRLHAQAATSEKLMAAITTDTSMEVNPAHASGALFN